MRLSGDDYSFGSTFDGENRALTEPELKALLSQLPIGAIMSTLWARKAAWLLDLPDFAPQISSISRRLPRIDQDCLRLVGSQMYLHASFSPSVG